jgi:hypothetical protein
MESMLSFLKKKNNFGTFKYFCISVVYLTLSSKLLIAAAWCSHHRASRVRQGRVSSRRALRLLRRGRERALCAVAADV